MKRKRLTEAKKDNVIADHYRFGAYVYDITVGFFNLFVGGAGRWRKTVVDLVSAGPTDKIAELCCGTGAVSLRVAKKTGEPVYACDLSPDQIKVAKWKSRLFRRNVIFSVQDASCTDYPKGFIDKVIISGALHEIKKDRRMAIYEEVKRILNYGGNFYTSEPVRPEKMWGRESFDFMFGKWNPEHDTAYELIDGGLEQEIGEAGFTLVESRYSNFGIFRTNRFHITD